MGGTEAWGGNCRRLRFNGCDIGRDYRRLGGVARARGPLRGGALGGLRPFQGTPFHLPSRLDTEIRETADTLAMGAHMSRTGLGLADQGGGRGYHALVPTVAKKVLFLKDALDVVVVMREVGHFRDGLDTFDCRLSMRGSRMRFWVDRGLGTFLSSYGVRVVGPNILDLDGLPRQDQRRCRNKIQHCISAQVRTEHLVFV